MAKINKKEVSAEKDFAAENRTKLIERFGKEKVAAWEKEYAPRKVNVIEVEGNFAILRPIGAKEISEFSQMTANPEIGIDKACEYLLDELWIDGDDCIHNDEEYFISAMMQVGLVIELKKSNFFRL